MPFYIKSPFKPSPILATAGFPVYLFGNYNDDTGPTLGFITKDSGNGTTSTVTFQILSGNTPAVGSLVTIIGSANAAGAYNVTNASIASVSTTTVGVCTITFAGSGNSSSAADGGQVYIPQPETADDVTTAPTNLSSIPVSRPYNNPNIQQGMSISASIMFPVVNANASCIVMLQGALQDLDSNYQDIGPLVGSFTGSTSGAAVPETLVAGQEYSFQTGTYTGLTSDSVLSDTYPGLANLPNYRFFRLRFYNVNNFGAPGSGATTAIGKLQF